MPRGAKKKCNLPYPWNIKYSRAKALAKYRNEYWNFTPETWFDMWVESGVMKHISNKPQGYCMVKKDPIEAWGTHNAIIIPRRMLFKKFGHEIWIREKAQFKDKHGVKGWRDDEESI